MHVGKVFRSGRTTTIEMPEGFEVEGSEVEVHREVGGILLRPLPAAIGSQNDRAWLDQFDREPDPELLDALDAMDEAIAGVRAADRAREKATGRG